MTTKPKTEVLITIKPSANKKRRTEKEQPSNLITVFPEEIIIYLLSFLHYRPKIVLLSKTCTFFNKLINNNPLCIKHYRFGTLEHFVERNKLFNKIQSFITISNNMNNNSNITTFCNKFSKLESLELLTMDPTLFPLLDIKMDENIVKLYIEYILKPLQNQLITLHVNTWLDAAISPNSFNFNNIQFNNVKNVCINGKDAKYPFHITNYIPNIEKLTLIGLELVPYSLFRMFFDTNKYIKTLLKLRFHDVRIYDSMDFYDSKFTKLLNSHTFQLKVYDITELDINQNGGQLQLFDYMWDHSRVLQRNRESEFILLMIIYNRFSLQSLRINYEIFYRKLNLKQFNMENWNGMTDFMERNKDKSIHLPKLEYLSMSISRVAAYEYKRINDDLLFYKLIVPKLHTIEIIPGLCCWHDDKGLIPFLIALIGEQFYKLKRIKIINANKTQQQYMKSSVETIYQIFKQNKQTVHIEY